MELKKKQLTEIENKILDALSGLSISEAREVLEHMKNVILESIVVKGV